MAPVAGAIEHDCVMNSARPRLPLGRVVLLPWLDLITTVQPGESFYFEATDKDIIGASSTLYMNGHEHAAHTSAAQSPLEHPAPLPVSARSSKAAAAAAACCTRLMKAIALARELRLLSPPLR